MSVDLKTKSDTNCNSSGGYPSLSHGSETPEGMFEEGQFFSRLTENAQAIESCFSKDKEFEQRIKLEEIDKAKSHVRASRLFMGLSDGEKKFFLKTVEEQILNPVVQSLPISNHEVYEIHRDLFWESLKRDAKDPKTYETRAAGIGLGLFISSVCPLAAVALFVGGSGYWIYDALRRRFEDARLVEQGQKTRDISLVFQGAQLWADGASSDVFDTGAAVTVVGMAKFLPKVVPARYLEPLPESLLPKTSPIEVVDLTKTSPIEVIDLSNSPMGNSTPSPEPIVMKAAPGNPSIGNAQGLSTGTAVNPEFVVSAKPMPPPSGVLSVESVGYDIAPSGPQQGGALPKLSPQGTPKSSSWFPLSFFPFPVASRQKEKIEAPGVLKDPADLPGHEKNPTSVKVDEPGINKEVIGDKEENPLPMKDPASSDQGPLHVAEQGNGYGLEGEGLFKLTDQNTQKPSRLYGSTVNSRCDTPSDKQFSRFVFQ
jgi:hypothetical protein